MHIAFVSQYFFPEQFSNNEIARWLVRQGHDVDAVCCVPNYPAGEFFNGYSNSDRREDVWEGVRIHRARTVARGKGKLSLLLNYLTYPPAAAIAMERKLGSCPDVSFVSMPSPLFQAFAGVYLKWRKKVPTVYWVQDIWPESATYTLGLKNPLIVKPLTSLCGWLYRRADLILVQSQAFPPMLERFGVDPAKIHFFPNTAPETYTPRTPDPDSAIGRMMPQGRFRLMFAGNIGESQDFDTYLATAELLKKSDAAIDWIIIGSGRDEERVKAEVTRRGLQDVFHFLGRHPEDSMPDFFSYADAMLVGLKDNPIFRLTVPYKVQCYMACGKPIVASLSGEGARVIDASGAGLTSPAQTPEKLASAIQTMADMTPAARSQMGDNARSFFEATYSADKIYGNLETWLKEAASRHKPT